MAKTTQDYIEEIKRLQYNAPAVANSGWNVGTLKGLTMGGSYIIPTKSPKTRRDREICEINDKAAGIAVPHKITYGGTTFQFDKSSSSWTLVGSTAK